jgi:8-amino-7-oxononanoate synthase
LKFPTIKEDHPLKFHIPIIPILTGYGLCLDLQRELREHGFLTHALQHPVVPKDGERLRVMMHANNTPDDISKLIGTLMNWGVINVNAIAKSRL